MSERIEKLKGAVEVMHRCQATHLESVPVVEMFGAKTVWEGVVEVFGVIGIPAVSRCYAWSYQDGKDTQFVTALGIPPVTNAQTAVRASIMAARPPGGAS